MSQSNPTDRRKERPVIPARPSDRIELTTTLPDFLTSFVGREREVAVISDLLRQQDVRLVTLTGPGGVGKTRLALRTAERMEPEFADGIAFVSLAAITDADLVVPTIARAFGLRDVGTPALAASLRDRTALLILDNLEHLLDAMPQVVSLLEACPAVKILATSRSILGVSGEHVVSVPPLALPTDRLGPDIDRLLQIEAVTLFVQRAVAADADFSFTEANAKSVTSICSRLDGLPLAIELATARLRHLPLTTLESLLQDRLPMLTGGPRDQPARLRTMRDAIAWSYDLLSPDQQQIFRQFSVFVGGFRLGAAGTVTGEAEGARTDIVSGVSSLIDHSLLRRYADPDGEPRYHMLETIREFGREQLAERGEGVVVGARHAAYYLEVAERASSALGDQSLGNMLASLGADLGNFRAALGWGIERHDSEFELRLVGALIPLWTAIGYVGEGYGALAGALARSDHVAPMVRARAVVKTNPMATFFLGVPEIAAGIVGAALYAFRDAGDWAGDVDATTWLATHALYRREVGRARALYEGALEQCRSHGDRLRAAWILCMLGSLHSLGTLERPQPDDDPVRAESFCNEALAVFREEGDRLGVARALHGLAYIAYKRRDFHHALALARETVELRLEINDRAGILPCLQDIADIAGKHGQAAQAARLYGAAAASSEAFGISLDSGPFQDEDDLEIAGLRRTLGDAAFAAAWMDGCALTLEQAASEAMVVTLDPSRDAAGDARGAVPAPSSLRSATGNEFGLTPREREVVGLVARGQSNREIADALFISVPTVKRHLTTILGKLEMPSRSALNTFAHEHNLA